ncbi:hypothetical protein GGQ74_001919 [Desulfobaculum xiamenense]|uniref:Uncharacterized protein n=1 Tax=Desulfobaculum xiamenense TaxID=995050 RepID=A0A846QHD9_9BACT|nr:hypothetical protein [Desulfobaculum xiamenense]NJB68246.1 hypothetical protein [Desulfobaculum xiamenense]
MSAFKCLMQHYLNPLHVYCRLRDMGVSTSLTRHMCSVYERYVYRIFSA